MTQHRELVDRYFRALNEEHWADLATVFDADAELRPSGAGPRHGRDDAIAFFGLVFERFPVHSDRPTRFLELERSIVVEINFSGRSRDGHEVQFEAVDIFDFTDGRIARLSQWFDTAALARQLSQQS